MLRVLGVAILVLAALWIAAAGAEGYQAKRPAEVIVREFRAVKSPGFQPAGMSSEEFHRRVETACRRWSELALELYRSHPRHAEVPKMMGVRWSVMVNTLDLGEEALEESSEVLGDKDATSDLMRAARYHKAYAALCLERVPLADKIRWVEDAAAATGTKEFHPGYLLEKLVIEHLDDPLEQRRLAKMALDAGIDDDYMGGIRSYAALLEKRGQRIELEFEDPRDRKRFSLDGSAGRYRLIHIWSYFPLCKDYVNRAESAEIEALKGLHARFDDSRLALVTLVEGGSEEGLPEFLRRVKPHEIPWPTHYDRSKLEEGWTWRLGVHQSGFYLLVDPDGNLDFVSARPEPVERRLARLLAPE